MHRINAELENRPEDHQTSMVEIQGMIQNFSFSILIDPGASLSYIYSSIVEKCKLPLNKFDKSWLVQLSTRTKRMVVKYVKNCDLMMDQFETRVKLNAFPLGSYDILIGMDWLEKHRVILNCFHKTFICLNKEGETTTIVGIPRKLFVRKISAL